MAAGLRIDTRDGEGLFDDPIALLQMEISRLEEELQLSQERTSATAVAEQEFQAQAVRITGLLADLAERDEVITLLEEHTRFLEEKLASQNAEWERLADVLDEVEGRIAGPAVLSPDIERERDEARGEVLSLQSQAELDRRQWEATRQQMAAEIERLRQTSADVVRATPVEARLAELVQENRSMSDRCQYLLNKSSESDQKLLSLQARCDEDRSQLDAALRELARAQAELDEERVANRANGPVARPSSATAPGDRELTANERIRALREHLSEIQQRAEEERKQRSLSARLTRLWQRVK